MEDTTQAPVQPEQKKIEKVVKQAAQQPMGQEPLTPEQNSEPAISEPTKEVKPKLKVPAKQPVAVAQPQPTAQSTQVPAT
ncbi:hypothetical protein KAR52_01870, partial [Candidatus Pacearchaeota archaeon]|nr:hypothetical protein [Candidatus Pacearchaeota archaeon]